MNDKGVLFIVSGPSATGKDTIVSEIIKNDPEKNCLSVSMTTRKPRGSETEGIDYFFVDTETFEKNIRENKMLEYAKYGDSYYGTPMEPVKNWLDSGKSVFLIIEVQGAAIVRKRFPDARSIFIMPPCMDALEKRMRLRGTEDDESIQKRLNIAKEEIKRVFEYDYVVINDKLREAIDGVFRICDTEVKVKNGIAMTDEEYFGASKYKTDNMINCIREVIENA